jgi:TRAP-type C4-dicarboxylate transport system substrate-binding protein
MVKHATTFTGDMYKTRFVVMTNPGKYNALAPQDKAVVDKLSGEVAARMFGEGWDKVDAASRELQKTQGVTRIMADKAFVKAVADKQDYLETKWAASAQVKGLKDPKKVLAEFRAEIAKVK